ncbi:GIY-YIG nuclease family protein [Patescibacteria group bacterium]|nr:GIY-YIG nuclease family protein [Patescibacteria group bacterium]
MFYVYVLKSKKDGSIYFGYTDDLRRRLGEHNGLKNKSTKNKAPFEVIYYEAYKSMPDAKYREKNIKRFAQAYSQLKRRIKNSLD